MLRSRADRLTQYEFSRDKNIVQYFLNGIHIQMTLQELNIAVVVFFYFYVVDTLFTQ